MQFLILGLDALVLDTAVHVRPLVSLVQGFPAGVEQVGSGVSLKAARVRVEAGIKKPVASFHWLLTGNLYGEYVAGSACIIYI